MERIGEITKEWLSISEYDLYTAKAMLDTGRYLYVAFMCQQAIEKMLKGIYVHRNKEIPPRTHNLLYLVDKLSIEVADQQKVLFSQLNQYYLESRYPVERARLAEQIDIEKAERFYTETEEQWRCLRKQLI